jgi:MFS family permease
MKRKLLQIVRQYLNSYTGLPKEAWWLAFVVLINRSGMMVVFFMTLYLTQKLHFTVGQAGQIMGVWGIGSLIGTYGGGRLSDRFGSFRIQWLSLFLGGIGFILLEQMRSYGSIAVMMFLFGVVAEAVRPASITAFTEVCPSEVRMRGIVLNRLAANLGIAIGPALGGFLARLNYSIMFWVDGGTSLLAALVFVLIFGFRKNHHHGIASSGEHHNHSPWKDRLFLFIMGLMLLLGIVFHQIFSTWPLYLKQVNNLHEDKIGFLFTINCLFIVLFEMPIVHRLEKRNLLRMVSIGIILLCSGFFLLPFGHSYGYVIMTVLLWTVGETFVFPLISAFVANRSDDRNRGQYMGAYTLVFSMSFILGPVVGTRLYLTLGPDRMWIGAGLAGLCISFGFILLNRHIQHIRAKQA